jgi:hypothetical protein
VLIPVGLFASFKLAGIITGPPTVSEVTRLQPTVWNLERPYEMSKIAGPYSLNTSYLGSDIALTVRFCPGEYDPKFPGPGPTLTTGLDPVNASVPKGFVESLQVVYKEAYSPSQVSLFYGDKGAMAYGNLTPSRVADGEINSQSLGEDKAYVKALAVGQPREVYVEGLWLLYYPNSAYNYTHYITIEITVTYFNGTAYKQLIQPIDFTFGPDHNNSFDEAEQIGFGLSRAYYVDDSVNGDPVDYFKISLQEGQKVTTSVLILEDYKLYPPISGLNPDVFIYDPNRNLEASLFLPGSNLHAHNATSQIVLNINQTGWWYVKVTTTFSYCLYVLNVTLVSG